MSVKLLAFDTFGTVTDWHSGVGRTLNDLFPDLDGADLARRWRGKYAPIMAEVESGARPWTLLDDLQRETLNTLLVNDFGVTASSDQLDQAVHSWHLIPGWPDAAGGIRRLKKKFVVCALSNGNVALLTEMAKNAGLEWDFIGGSDLWGHYKPSPATYLGLAGLMQVEPSEVMMVATHATDLEAARSYGLRTAYIDRPDEFGTGDKPNGASDLDDFHAVGVDDLADQLGC